MKTTKIRWDTDEDGTWFCALVPREEAIEAAGRFEDGKAYNIEVRRAYKKRSLDANGYAWLLMDKLAAHYRVPVLEVYRNFVKEIGGNSDIVCMKSSAVETFCRSWERNGLGWQTEVFPSRLSGCTNVKVYYGSSVYDTAQMSRLIDLIVQECKIANIETATPDEIQRVMALWEQKEAERKDSKKTA